MGDHIDADQDQRLALLELRMKEAEKKIDKISTSIATLQQATSNLLGTVDTVKYWIYGINAVTVLAVIGAIIKMVGG